MKMIRFWNQEKQGNNVDNFTPKPTESWQEQPYSKHPCSLEHTQFLSGEPMETIECHMQVEPKVANLSPFILWHDLYSNMTQLQTASGIPADTKDVPPVAFDTDFRFSVKADFNLHARGAYFQKALNSVGMAKVLLSVKLRRNDEVVNYSARQKKKHSNVHRGRKQQKTFVKGTDKEIYTKTNKKKEKERKSRDANWCPQCTKHVMSSGRHHPKYQHHGQHCPR